MNNKIVVPDNLLDEIQGLFTEGEFNSRWTLIETYHEVGRIICTRLNGNRTDILHAIAPQIGKSVRSLWYATKFYETYPDINALPEGKNITWNKIVTKHLTATTQKEKCKHEHREIVSFEKCEDCGENLGKVAHHHDLTPETSKG